MIQIWKMQLPLTRKLGVCGIFLLGFLTVGAGIAKTVIYYNVFRWLMVPTNYDITYSQTPFVYWPMVESSLGIIGACLPLLRPLFAGAKSHGFMRHLHTFKSSNEGSETYWDQPSDSQLAKAWDAGFQSANWGSVGSGSTKLGNGSDVGSEKGKFGRKQSGKGDEFITAVSFPTPPLPTADRREFPFRSQSSLRKAEEVSMV